MGLLFAAMMGWCGTRWPGWFWELIRRKPPPPPDPDNPVWHDIAGGLIGAIGGAGAVIVFAPMLVEASLTEIAATAFFGGVFLGSLANGLMGMARR